jgi:hypothetical protein
VLSYGPESVSHGTYTKDAAQIQQYGTVYRMCWGQGKKLESSRVKKGITMETLLQ